MLKPTLTNLSKLSVGEKLYVDTTNGSITETAPSVSGEIIRIIGYAVDANTLYFDPDNTWAEV